MRSPCQYDPIVSALIPKGDRKNFTVIGKISWTSGGSVENFPVFTAQPVFYTAAGAPSVGRRLDKAGGVRYSDSINCMKDGGPGFSPKSPPLQGGGDGADI
jgi:hypothetical protein